ncbi:hypothetical protein [Trichlorobacter ammonificans]|uniref:Protein NO VEIN C-terminal domain-containing protein n=1 Tax=Trichlorobacter ammonificans TaxID=2916410 RepID=A0ABN8HG18_9BACT|nr:hypothetical protein [Trichlorobacter ammonificans]CAH2031722.1 conserved protein of unknown function [Trichlorobacter ammonificans]
MPRKLALKRLSSSDLTIFEHHFRQTTGAKQKGINLDKAVIIGRFFPALQSRADLRSDALILSVFGPDGAGLQTVTRKVLKQQKNWRLNGEYIKAPDNTPNRYDSLEKDDFALLEFTGDVEPKAVRICLIARASAKDISLHTELDKVYGARFSERCGMIEVTGDELSAVLTKAEVAEDHPILDFTDVDALEDAVLGGVDGLSTLLRRRKSRGVTQEELAKARQNASQTGRLGEELVDEWLENEKAHGHFFDYQWESDANAIAPFDFVVSITQNDSRKVDVKSTAGEFTNPIHISMSELIEIATSETPYDIYRLYAVLEDFARMRIASNLREFASIVISSLGALPPGVKIDGISVDPRQLPFEENEIVIDFREESVDV